MKYIKNPTGNWQLRLNSWCNNLSHKQRLRLVLIISIIYFLMSLGVFLWIYLDETRNKGIEIRHIQSPVPIIQQSPETFIVPDGDSSITDKTNQNYGKERK